MPHEFEDILASRRRREAQAITATIDSPISDGTGDYLCVRADKPDSLVRACVHAAATTYAKRTPIALTRNDDGTTAGTAGYTITQNRSVTRFGTAFALPSSGTGAQPGSSVTLISPNPITFHRTDVKTILIYGTGLSAASIVYGSADLTDNSAPVKTSTLITLSVVASGGAAYGMFDLTIDGVTFKNFFTISA